MAYYSEFDKCSFYTMGNEEINRMTNTVIFKKEIKRSGAPVEDGLYDLRMGVIDYNQICHLCEQKQGMCPGHFGKINLKYPVKNPLFIDKIYKWLKIICHKCGNLLYQKSILKKNLTKTELFSEYIKNSNTIKECKTCGAEVYKIKRNADFKTQIEKQIESKSVLLLNTEIKNILEKVNINTLLKLKRDLTMHPSKYIINTILIIPNTARPEDNNISEKSRCSDFTSILKNIIDINEKIVNIDSKNIDENIKNQLIILDQHYSILIKGGSINTQSLNLITNTNKQTNGIADKIPKKTGIIRQNIMGKRVENMIRSVISGDPYINIDEVGIPISIAKQMYIAETMNSYNQERLNIFYNNGPDIHPGCIQVLKKETGYKSYIVKKLHENNYKLKMGDIIHRHIIDNDIIGFNRQPSLLPSSISTHKIKILNKNYTMTMNVSACSLYNADFDGDQMNGIVFTDIQAINESSKISSNGNWFIDFRSPNPIMGLFQDSLIGASEITSEKIKLDKWHAMSLLEGVPDYLLKNINIDQNFYTGKEILSLLIPDNINIINKTPKIFMKQYQHIIKYSEDQKNVVIKKGKILSGILDKNTVSQGCMNSLFQLIYNKYGSKKTIDIIYGMQHIISNFFYYHGYTTGLKDFILSENTIKNIKRNTKKVLNESLELVEKLNNNKLITPIYYNLKEFYELSQLNILSICEESIESVLQNLDFKNNGLVKLVFSGSKGKKNHLIAINIAVGQQEIKGKRPPHSLGFNRTSIYFHRSDMHPIANGYVVDSYFEGFSPESFIFLAQSTRLGLINNALSTSISGYQNRLAIKALESNIIDNMYKVAKNGYIRQLLYGGSGFNVLTLLETSFLTLKLSDKDLKNQFKTNIGEVLEKYRNKDTEKILEKEFNSLVDDRNKCRDLLLTCEYESCGNYILKDKIFLPINMKNTLEDLKYNFDLENKKSDLNPTLAIKSLISFLNSLGYIFYNHIQKENKMEIPYYIKKSMELLKIYLKQYLCIKMLLKHNIDNNLLENYVYKTIFFNLKKSLINYGTAVGIIAAQVCSEPLTQYVLDSKHRSGIVTGEKTSVMDRIREILGAKSGDKMKNITMLIRVKPEYEDDNIKVKKIINDIEMIKFDFFVMSIYLFFEDDYITPKYPGFESDKEIIDFYIKLKCGSKQNFDNNILDQLSKYCFYFELDNLKIIEKNISLIEITSALELLYPNILFIPSSITSSKVFIRAYLYSDFFKNFKTIDIKIFYKIKQMLCNSIIKGIEGVKNARIKPLMKTYRDFVDGSIQTKKIYAIKTSGLNIEDIIDNKYIDPYLIQTDSIIDIQNFYGIDAARNKIIDEMLLTMPSLSYIHSSIYADEITYSGECTSMSKQGLKKREKNALLEMAFENPIQTIEDSAFNNVDCDLYGVSASLIVGSTPKCGTNYNSIILNENFIRAQEKKKDENIDEILGI